MNIHLPTDLSADKIADLKSHGRINMELYNRFLFKRMGMKAHPERIYAMLVRQVENTSTIKVTG